MIVLHTKHRHTHTVSDPVFRFYFVFYQFHFLSCSTALSLVAILLVHTALRLVSMPRVAIRNYEVPRSENSHLVSQIIQHKCQSLVSHVVTLYFILLSYFTLDNTPRHRHVTTHSFSRLRAHSVHDFRLSARSPTPLTQLPQLYPSRRASLRYRLPYLPHLGHFPGLTAAITLPKTPTDSDFFLTTRGNNSAGDDVTGPRRDGRSG